MTNSGLVFCSHSFRWKRGLVHRPVRFWNSCNSSSRDMVGSCSTRTPLAYNKLSVSVGCSSLLAVLQPIWVERSPYFVSVGVVHPTWREKGQCTCCCTNRYELAGDQSEADMAVEEKANNCIDRSELVHAAPDCHNKLRVKVPNPTPEAAACGCRGLFI